MSEPLSSNLVARLREQAETVQLGGFTTTMLEAADALERLEQDRDRRTVKQP